MMNKKLFLWVCFALCGLWAAADKRSLEEASKIAQTFVAQNKSTKASSLLSLSSKALRTRSNGLADSLSAPFYVFNIGTNQGFVLVSTAHDAPAVLGYSLEGAWKEEDLPIALKTWIEGMRESIYQREKEMPQRTTAKATAHADVGASRLQTVVLDTPNWNQDAPYNCKCPMLNGYQFYTGCTATATAMVMGYHQWPLAGEGTLKGYMANSYYHLFVPDLPLGATYAWDDMPYLHGNALDPTNEQQAEAVGSLMYHIGVMARSRYDYGQTGAWLEPVARGLVKHMKYQKQLVYLMRKDFSKQWWCNMLRDEIDHHRPIIYCGYTPTNGDGHAFVIDGYDNEGRFAVNWGWGGANNGFFYLDGLEPSSQGIGGSEGGYNNRQSAIVRIAPDKDEEEVDEYDHLFFNRFRGAPTGLCLSDAQHMPRENEEFEIGIGRVLNLGTRHFYGHIRLVMTDYFGKVKEVLFEEPQTEVEVGMGIGFLPLDKYRDKIRVTIHSHMDEGDRIRLLFQYKGEKTWQPIVAYDPEAHWEIVLREGIPPIAISDGRLTEDKQRWMATFSAEVPTTPSAKGVEAFYAVATAEGRVRLIKIEPRGEQLVVPAHVGVLLSAPAASTFVMLPTEEDAPSVPQENILRPTTSIGMNIHPSSNAYYWNEAQGQLGFAALQGTTRRLAPNQAYILWPDSYKWDFLQLENAATTHIETTMTQVAECGPFFNLHGVQTTNKTAGSVYIENGKKFIAH